MGAAADPIPLGASFAFGIGIRTLDEQLRRIESLDTKAGVLLAATGVLTGFLVSQGSRLGEAPKAVGIATVVSLLTAMLACLAAFSVRRYLSAPSFASALQLVDADEAWLQWRLTGALRRAVEVNEAKLAWKATLLVVSTRLLMAAVALMGAYLVPTAWTG